MSLYWKILSVLFCIISVITFFTDHNTFEFIFMTFIFMILAELDDIKKIVEKE